jgi:hypothetical protein
MSHYLLTVRLADGEPSHEEFVQFCTNMPALNAKMEEAGVFVFHAGLRGGSASATVVRHSGEDFLITDGPYAETKEHLAGFWVINVANLEEALEWAKLAAVAHLRPIEVRPFEERDIDELLAASAAGDLLSVHRA